MVRKQGINGALKFGFSDLFTIAAIDVHIWSSVPNVHHEGGRLQHQLQGAFQHDSIWTTAEV